MFHGGVVEGWFGTLPLVSSSPLWCRNTQMNSQSIRSCVDIHCHLLAQKNKGLHKIQNLSDGILENSPRRDDFILLQQQV